MKHIIKAGRRLDDSVASWITAAAVVAVAGDGAGVRMLLALDLLGVRLVAGHIRVLVRRRSDAVAVLASGRRVDGSLVQGQAAYFAKGARVVQVVMYAPKINPVAADTFFTSLRIE